MTNETTTNRGIPFPFKKLPAWDANPHLNISQAPDTGIIERECIARERMKYRIPSPKSPEKDTNPHENISSTQNKNVRGSRGPEEATERSRMSFERRNQSGESNNSNCTIS